MRTVVLIAAFGLSPFGCNRTPAQDKRPPATVPEAQASVTPDAAPRRDASHITLVDLSTSLAAARTEFNAHKGEARFLTLLSPT